VRSLLFRWCVLFQFAWRQPSSPPRFLRKPPRISLFLESCSCWLLTTAKHFHVNKKNIYIYRNRVNVFEFWLFHRCSLVASGCWAAIDDMFRIRRTKNFYWNKFLSVKFGFKFLK
jgi:hypothetical protein